MNKFTINPQSLASNFVGFEDFFRYSITPSPDDQNYNFAFNNGGLYEETEFRLSEKAHFQPKDGTSIADRFVEFVIEDQIYLVESPIFKVSRPKIINKTNVYGYDGTIKEFVALGDYNIDFTFYLFGKRRFELQYDDTKNFLDLAELDQSIQVNSPFLNYVYDITDVVFESINTIEEHQTYKNVLMINLTMSSDNVYEPFEEKQI